MSHQKAKNIVLALSLCANVVVGSLAAHYWLKTRAAELGLSSNGEALKSVAGASLLPTGRIEFPLADDAPADGLSAVSHDGGSPSTLYVHPDAIIANADIESAKAVRDDYGRPAVRLTLTEEGRKSSAMPLRRIG
jgi:hypothetical protein